MRYIGDEVFILGRCPMDENDFAEETWGGPDYRRPEEIGPSEIRQALSSLELFNDDPFLRMQALNLDVVDGFIIRLEYGVLQKLIDQEATPIPEVAFLLAQSQMWIFAAYELMRTWRQRAKDIIKWTDNGGLEAKLQEYEKNIGFPHFGRELRAAQIKHVLTDPAIIDKVKSDLRLTHMLFARIQAVRVSIAKHEVSGQKNSIALMPGYARINKWCGALDFDLEGGAYSLGDISRRDIADGIRTLMTVDSPPTPDELREFDAFMRGPSTAGPIL